jgi:hypothetical protein
MVRVQHMSAHIVHRPNARRSAAWAFAALAIIAAAVAVWHAPPQIRQGDALGVPAASSPAADAGPPAIQS